MTPDIVLRKGDLLPIYTFQLLYRDGTPVDLTTATSVTLTMFKEGALPSSTPKINAVACVVNTPSQGTGTYSWSSGDTDTPGDYKAFITATFSGKTLTCPNLGFIWVQIVDIVD